MTDIRQRIVTRAQSLSGRGPDCCSDAAPGYDLTKVSWCQIFWLHLLRSEGLTTDTWRDVARAGWTGAWLLLHGHGRTTDPQPGDLGYITHNQHGAVVQRIDGEWVWTIDGNSVGGVVRERKRHRSEFAAFFSIGGLISALEKRDTEPAPPPSGRTQRGTSGDHETGPANSKASEIKRENVITRRDISLDKSPLIHQSVLDAWHEFSEPFEGRVHWMYRDVKGLVTTGVGNLIDPVDRALVLPWIKRGEGPATRSEVEAEWLRVKAMPAALHYQRYRGELTLDDEAINRLVRRALESNAMALSRSFDGWETWPADAQLGALSLAWAVGTSLAKWPQYAAACRRRDWMTAARECQIRSAGNPGVVPRNRAQAVAFRNASVVDSGNPALRRSECYWPLELEPTP